LKTILSFKFKISILVVLILLIPGIYFAITQLSVPVEQDLMSEFKAAPAVPSGKQDATDGIAPVDVLLVGLKQRLNPTGRCRWLGTTVEILLSPGPMEGRGRSIRKSQGPGIYGPLATTAENRRF
jgi:hypothetical protein